MKKKTVAVYARVSTDKQKVDMQLQALSDFIKRSGWKLYKQYRSWIHRRKYKTPVEYKFAIS